MADGLMVALDASVKQNPNLDLAQDVFRYSQLSAIDREAEAGRALKQKLLDAITADNMLPYYNALCERFQWAADESLREKMRSANEAAFVAIEAKHQEAIESAGDSEVFDALLSRARLHSTIGDAAAAYAAYDVLLSRDKTTTSKRLDIHMDKFRLAFFTGDVASQRRLLSESQKLMEAAGDWDRRNRLKVYEALYLINVRDIRKAAPLLIDSIATFTCTELCSYETFMLYAVCAAVLALGRAQLKKQVVKNPQVIAVLRENADLATLLKSIYDCDYRQFFMAILAIQPVLLSDRYLSQHVAYIIREYRVLAYAQFLEAYKSVTLASMASAFGMSIELLDAELSRFIASSRIDAKIDKVGGAVLTVRPDKKNAQYQEVMKRGDLLLNRVQTLARLIEL